MWHAKDVAMFAHGSDMLGNGLRKHCGHYGKINGSGNRRLFFAEHKELRHHVLRRKRCACSASTGLTLTRTFLLSRGKVNKMWGLPHIGGSVWLP